MQVSAGMSSMVVTVSPGLTLHDAARAMSERKVGAAVVIDPEQPGPGIITERDVLQSVGAGPGPEHRAGPATTSRRRSPSRRPTGRSSGPPRRWSRGGFRHLVVVDGGEMVGVLSMRDIVRCWVEDGATSRRSRGTRPSSEA